MKNQTKPTNNNKKGVKVCKETLGEWDHGCGSYLDCSDVCMYVQVKIYPLYVVTMFNLLCTNFTSMKLLT